MRSLVVLSAQVLCVCATALAVHAHDVEGTNPARDFAAEAARLSARADAVDRVWQAYRARCQRDDVRGYDFGREWFALWDRVLVPAPGDVACAALLRTVVAEGGSVLTGLTAASRLARASGVPAMTIHGAVRWNGLEWWPLTVTVPPRAETPAGERPQVVHAALRGPSRTTR